jgi:hypothetical protein
LADIDLFRSDVRYWHKADMSGLGRPGGDGLIVLPNPIFNTLRESIAEISSFDLAWSRRCGSWFLPEIKGLQFYTSSGICALPINIMYRDAHGERHMLHQLVRSLNVPNGRDSTSRKPICEENSGP